MKLLSVGANVIALIVLLTFSGCGGGGGSSSQQDVSPPLIISTNPDNTAVAVPIDVTISANFSENIDNNSITTSTFFLDNGVSLLPGTITVSGSTVSFVPSTSLQRNTSYNATLTTGVRDIAGNAMINPFLWNFTTAWTQQFGTGDSEYNAKILFDINGNIFLTGQTGDDYFLTKLTPSGDISWNYAFSSPGYFLDQSSDIAIGSDGSIYLVGYTYGNLDGNSNSGESDIFVSKYNNTGTLNWTRLYGGAGFEFGKSVMLDTNGNLYVLGIANATGTNGNYDVLLLKYSSSGVLQWNRQYGASNVGELAQSIELNNAGEIVVIGFGVILDGGGQYTNDSDPFLLKYNTDGTLIYDTTINVPDYNAVNAVEIDANDDMYVLCNSGLIKTNTSGSILWYDNTISGNSITIDSTNNIYVAGTNVTKYDDGRNMLWTKVISGTAFNIRGYGGYVFVTANVSEGVDGNIYGGNGDIALYKYGNDGKRY